MPVTVGTDVYETIAGLDLYHADRSNADWAALTTDQKESLARQATDWIDRNFRFRGTRATADQRLAWPRKDAYDDDDFQVGKEDAPRQVKEACAIVSDVLRQGVDLVGIVTDDSSITRTRVDVLEVEYDASKRIRGQAVLSHVIQLLNPLTLQSGALLRT
jgi:hypothetical protein